MAEFRIDRIRFNWKGPSYRTAYIKDDVISYGGKFLLHLAATASADFNTDLDFLVAGESIKWEQMGDGRPKGEWQPKNS